MEKRSEKYPPPQQTTIRRSFRKSSSSPLCIYMFIKICFFFFSPLSESRRILYQRRDFAGVHAHAVHSDFIHSEAAINQVLVRTQGGGGGMCCLADNRRHDDLIDEHCCSDQRANAHFEASKKKIENPLQKICLCNRRDFTSGLPCGKPKIYKSAKEQMNPSWPEEIFVLTGF